MSAAMSSREIDKKLNSWRLFTVIGSLCLGVFLFGLDVSIIAVAIPQITTQFRSLLDVSWYGSAYMLTLTAFQPLFGNLYKYFNAKVVYLTSLGVFEVGSVICAAAPTSAVLIFGRAWLGLGGAGLLQGALAIIGEAVTVDKVPLFQSIVVSSMAVSVCCGPVIGGALTQYVSWHWCFWINVPAGVFVIAVVLVFVPLRASNKAHRNLSLGKKMQHMDAPGLVIFLGAICCLLLALTWGGQAYPWNDQNIIGLFVGFGVLVASFCYWLVRQGDLALIPVRVLKRRPVHVGALTLLGFGVLSVVYGYYLPILFQSAQGVSTTESGLRYIALVGPQIVALVIVGGIVSKWGYYVPYMISGSIVCSVGAGLLTTVNLSTPTVQWAAYLVITGIGLGMAGQLPYTAVQAVLDPADIATGNAINVFSFHLAGAISTAIGQALLLDGLRVAVPQHTDAVPSEAVIQAGATGLQMVATSPTVLHALRMAYVEAVRRTIILGLTAMCLVVPLSCAMEWVNLKKVAEQRSQVLAPELTSTGGEDGNTPTEKSGSS
ncbi:major facilitator superfamily domain-containing protein [Apiospora arundinis]|uniref:Major facilitator superfamily domain-containing protein n=1 Tax=Apiospora arundinis TaxID=335852 RepID=A0ABR2I0D0_9PEZI